LTEAELGVGLGAVAGDYLGDRPGLTVGEQDPFAEDFGFQRVLRLGVDGDGEAVLGRCGAGQFAVQDPV
jgi:hypothetical protein